jgi:hypothetical protein
MKSANLILITGASLCLMGCASSRQVAVLEPVGPAPAGRPGAAREGVLQVYSARQKADVDVNEEEFRYNNDFGRNDFLYEPAHTDYTIYTPQGKLVEHVKNARDPEDAQPALVALPAGTYKVKAQAEINGTPTTVMVPVQIAPGRCTPAYLEGDWQPHGQYDKAQVVRLPDGQIAGWRAVPNENLNAGVKGPS